MSFFHYSQDNSGGEFHWDEKVAPHVIVEAENPDKANLRAEEIGIYFDGCENDLDCSCCGDRWSRASDSEKGTDTPKIYGKDPAAYACRWTPSGKSYAIIYPLTGEPQRFRQRARV